MKWIIFSLIGALLMSSCSESVSPSSQQDEIPSSVISETIVPPEGPVERLINLEAIYQTLNEKKQKLYKNSSHSCSFEGNHLQYDSNKKWELFINEDARGCCGILVRNKIDGSYQEVDIDVQPYQISNTWFTSDNMDILKIATNGKTFGGDFIQWGIPSEILYDLSTQKIINKHDLTWVDGSYGCGGEDVTFGAIVVAENQINLDFEIDGAVTGNGYATAMIDINWDTDLDTNAREYTIFFQDTKSDNLIPYIDQIKAIDMVKDVNVSYVDNIYTRGTFLHITLDSEYNINYHFIPDPEGNTPYEKFVLRVDTYESIVKNPSLEKENELIPLEIQNSVFIHKDELTKTLNVMLGDLRGEDQSNSPTGFDSSERNHIEYYTYKNLEVFATTGIVGYNTILVRNLDDGTYFELELGEYQIQELGTLTFPYDGVMEFSANGFRFGGDYVMCGYTSNITYDLYNNEIKKVETICKDGKYGYLYNMDNLMFSTIDIVENEILLEFKIDGEMIGNGYPYPSIDIKNNMETNEIKFFFENTKMAELLTYENSIKAMEGIKDVDISYVDYTGTKGTVLVITMEDGYQIKHKIISDLDTYNEFERFIISVESLD